MKKWITRTVAASALAVGLGLGATGAASASNPNTNYEGVGMIIVTAENGGITSHFYGVDGSYMGYWVQR